MRFRSLPLFLLCLALAAACQTPLQNSMEQKRQATGAQADTARDVHSHSNPEQIRVRHVDLDLDVLFDRKVLKGRRSRLT